MEVLDCGCHGELIPFGMRIDKAADAVVFLNLAGGYFIHVTDPSELKKLQFPVKFVFCRRKRSQKKSNWKRIEKKRYVGKKKEKLQQRIQKKNG